MTLVNDNHYLPSPSHHSHWQRGKMGLASSDCQPTPHARASLLSLPMAMCAHRCLCCMLILPGRSIRDRNSALTNELGSDQHVATSGYPVVSPSTRHRAIPDQPSPCERMRLLT